MTDHDLLESILSAIWAVHFVLCLIFTILVGRTLGGK